MKKLRRSMSARVAAAIVACTGAAALGATAITTGPAGADPGYANGLLNNPIVGVGSNTVEDLFNAYSGQEPSPGIGTPTFYGDSADGFAPDNLPMHDPGSAGDVGGRRIYSFDAENPYDPTNIANVGCVTTKVGGNAFDRPNGSKAGRIALSDSISPTTVLWYQVGPPSGNCGGQATPPGPGQSTVGQIDFSRSSSGPAGTLIAAPTSTNCGSQVGCITFIPFARDGLSFAFFMGSGISAATQALISKMSAAAPATGNSDMFTIYNKGSAGGVTVPDIPGVTFFACSLNVNSGTWSTFLTDIGNPANAVTTGQANNCSALEEQSGDDFVTHVNGGVVPAANTVWVEPFSASAWVAQANGAAQDRSSTARTAGVLLGDPDGTALCGATASCTASPANPNNQPFSGTAPNLVPDQVYNGTATWGRNIYVIVPWHKIAGAVGQRVPAMTNIFGNPFAASPVTGELCKGEAQAILGTFGFTTLTASAEPACGIARPSGDVSNHYAFTEALTTGQA
jgi:hypothetical protein